MQISKYRVYCCIGKVTPSLSLHCLEPQVLDAIDLLLSTLDLPCRITNQSGLKLSYWVEPASGNSHLLRPFQSSDLHVEPVEKSVIMPDSQQHVTARTICMQFEGNWSPVQDIIVDKVGKYAYTIGSHHDRSVTPVVMDVSLDIRTKV